MANVSIAQTSLACECAHLINIWAPTLAVCVVTVNSIRPLVCSHMSFLGGLNYQSEGLLFVLIWKEKQGQMMIYKVCFCIVCGSLPHFIPSELQRPLTFLGSLSIWKYQYLNSAGRGEEYFISHTAQRVTSILGLQEVEIVKYKNSLCHVARQMVREKDRICISDFFAKPLSSCF